MSKPAIAVLVSENKKLGSKYKPCSATYVSQVTCPKSCKLRGCGCYAEYGYSRYIVNRLNSSKVSSPASVAHAEALEIKMLAGVFPLRLHVVGDCYNRRSAEILAKAAEEYTDRFNKPVWCYTQNHKIPREAWGSISILRSCMTYRQVRSSMKAGFACALIVDKFPKNYLKIPNTTFWGRPCPAMLDKNIHCSECLLCTKDKELLERGEVILFEAHGTGKNLVKETLKCGGR